MIDHVKSLKSRGVSAAILSSNRGIDKGLVTTSTEVSSEKYCFQYTAPRHSLVAIAVDKEYCVYKW